MVNTFKTNSLFSDLLRGKKKKKTEVDTKKHWCPNSSRIGIQNTEEAIIKANSQTWFQFIELSGLISVGLYLATGVILVFHSNLQQCFSNLSNEQTPFKI